MKGTRRQGPLFLAAASAVTLIAQQVGSKAVRDALFLSNFDVTSLPLMVIGAAAFSILMVLAASRAMTRFGPAWLVPRVLIASAALLMGEWFLITTSPRVASVLVYLHVASLGSLLVSGFWSVVNETFDPRSAKVQIGRIAVAAALGGVLGGVVAARVAMWFEVHWVLPTLAFLQLVAATTLWPLRPPRNAWKSALQHKDSPPPTIRETLKRAPYLRDLGIVVFLATLGAALFDYVFKARASAAYVTDADLLRFFAFFHTAVGLSTFLIQSIASRVPMEHLGLSDRVSSNPLALALGSACALIAPGVPATGFLRGAHTVLSNSLFRSGYEAMFSPVSPRDKRATKQILDVGFERAGDAAGGGVVRLLLLLPAHLAITTILLVAVGVALVAFAVARRLRAGYVGELEQRLMSGMFRIDPSDLEDPMSRTMMMGSMASIAIPVLDEKATGDSASGTQGSGAADSARGSRARDSAAPGSGAPGSAVPGSGGPGSTARSGTPGSSPADSDALDSLSFDPTSPPPDDSGVGGVGAGGTADARGGHHDAARRAGDPHADDASDALVRRIRDLRSGDPETVRAALRDRVGAELAPHVIPLLAWDMLYPHAARALVQSLDRLEGQLVDHLLDADEEFAIRRRIPGILCHSSSRMVIEGLLHALLDTRFEVRFRAGRALARIHARDPGVPIDRHRVFAIVLRETRVDRGVWESQRLLDQLDESEEDAIVEDYVRARSNRSLQHVFTVLSLALDKRPLRVAFKGLQTDDPMLRGTALEYLESALPDDIRESLWPFLEDRRRERTTRKREDILDALMNSHASIQINLEQLRKRMADQSAGDTPAPGGPGSTAGPQGPGSTAGPEGPGDTPAAEGANDTQTPKGSTDGERGADNGGTGDRGTDNGGTGDRGTRGRGTGRDTPGGV